VPRCSRELATRMCDAATREVRRKEHQLSPHVPSYGAARDAELAGIDPTGWHRMGIDTRTSPDPFEAPISRSYHGPGQPMQGQDPQGSIRPFNLRQLEPVTSAHSIVSRRPACSRVIGSTAPTSAWRDERVDGGPHLLR
jgi:hypothetical protein